MLDYQKAFIQFAIDLKVMQFGQFTLKSGRVSPYFFNAGLFNTGKAISQLGCFYAEALMRSGQSFDTLFGPAYKGIPLVTATAIALYEKFNQEASWCFNRKEIKDHGEGGNIVGAPLKGRTVIVDDVISAGTAIREVLQLFATTEATPISVLIAFNRQEKGQGGISAIEEIQNTFDLPVVSIVTLDNVVEFIKSDSAFKQYYQAIYDYRERYGTH